MKKNLIIALLIVLTIAGWSMSLHREPTASAQAPAALASIVSRLRSAANVAACCSVLFSSLIIVTFRSMT